MIRAAFYQVGKRFGERVVFSGLSFELKSGGRYGLLGPNGAGKSTLVRLLAGVLQPDQGTVKVDGLEPWREPGRVRSGLGLLPEGAPLVGELTVAEHLRLTGRLRGWAGSEYKREEERLITALGLAGFYHRPAAVLSQGQKRRAGLASALWGSPDFLILDEPTSGLDPEESARLLSLLRGLPVSSTLLVSSHILNEIRALTADVLVLAQGRLAAFGPWDHFWPEDSLDETRLRAGYLKLIQPETES